jgi:hypothetical protein
VALCHTFYRRVRLVDQSAEKPLTCCLAGLLIRHLKVRSYEPMSLNDLEFAYAPVRNQVRDLREYL